MSLFDKHFEKLKEFREDPRMVKALKNYTILSKNEFLNWFTPAPEPTRSRTTDKIKEANSKLVNEILSKVCVQKIRIGHGYARSSLSRVMPKRVHENVPPDNKYDKETQMIRADYDFDHSIEGKFDLIVAVDKEILEKSSATTEEKIKAVVSFLITELGECKKKPNTISVNLICSRGGVSATQMLGAMLYCIKVDTKYDQEAILELAGSYTNIPGFISYSRIGFDRDETLFGNDCFPEIDLLPMSVNIDFLEPNDIINYASVAIKRKDANDESNLYLGYLHKNQSTETQEALSQLGIFLHKIKLNQDKKKDPLSKSLFGNQKLTKKDKEAIVLEHIRSKTPKNTPGIGLTSPLLRRQKSKTKSLVKSAKKIFEQKVHESASESRKRSRSKSQTRSQPKKKLRRSNSTPSKSKASKSKASKSKSKDQPSRVVTRSKRTKQVKMASQSKKAQQRSKRSRRDMERAGF
jgi:hypothetical protein